MTQPGAPVSESGNPLTGAPSVPLIELNGLTVRFGNRDILLNLTASLRGRAIGLLGPNGAGKSTLINTLLGFYKPVQRLAKVFGEDISNNLKHIRSLIGYMPENDSFIANMNAVSFIRMMGELSGSRESCTGARSRGPVLRGARRKRAIASWGRIRWG